MRIANDALINAPVDWSVPWVSDPIYLGHIIVFSIQLVWNGSPVGMLSLQACDDAGLPNLSSPDRYRGLSNWTDVENSEQMVSMSGNHTWQHREAGFLWVRAVWTPTSGTATLSSARFTIKGS